MDHTANMGLTIYAGTDKFRISQSENSFNANMEIIDRAVVLKEMTWEDLEEEEEGE